MAGPAVARDFGPDALTVTAQCRSGKAQGGYALRAANGRLRAQGAYNQGQRTGSFFFWSADGARIAQLPFDADVLSGTLSLWYDGADAKPARKLQARYRGGERDGITRMWSVEGRLRGEFEYVDGALAAHRAWDESGAALPEADARDLALRERDETAAFVATLLATLTQHPPDCRPPPARLQAAGGVAPLAVAAPAAGTGAYDSLTQTRGGFPA
jgi:hypothetical protein